VSQNPDTKTATCMHGVETVIYLREFIPMRDILVDLHVSFQIICSREKVSRTIVWRECKTLTLDNARQFGAPFYTSESSPTPNASSDQLETMDLNNTTKP
jgi:hypothetical protein